MISFVHRKDIDLEKYNFCIQNAVQSRVYAYSWYLDCICDHWSVLVLDDYKAVMPLPWKKKFLLKYISQPFFCQQLGVFSQQEIDNTTVNLFLESIPKHFIKTDLQFHSGHVFPESTHVLKKVNYILTLNRSYESIYKTFTKGRKHAIKQGANYGLKTTDFLIDELIILAKKHYNFTSIKEEDYDRFKKLVRALLKEEKAILNGVRDAKEKLIGGAVFLINNDRITYLFAAISEEGRKQQVASFLLNEMIQKFADTDFTLDFEGSEIPGVASFYRSFNAVGETYYRIQKNKLPL
jgi:hypothetical protein